MPLRCGDGGPVAAAPVAGKLSDIAAAAIIDGRSLAVFSAKSPERFWPYYELRDGVFLQLDGRFAAPPGVVGFRSIPDKVEEKAVAEFIKAGERRDVQSWLVRSTPTERRTNTQRKGGVMPRFYRCIAGKERAAGADIV